jgi:hypothetical protein
MSFEACKSLGNMHELFDQAASLKLLGSDRTLAQVAALIKQKVGLAPSVPTLSRLQNGVAVLSIPGLRETEYSKTFYTPSHIAERGQCAELDLRTAQYAKRDMLEAITRAKHVLKELRKDLAFCQRLLDRAGILCDAAVEAEHRLDQAAVDSLAQQISLHQSKLHNDTECTRLLKQGLNFGLSAMHHLQEPLTLGTGERADLIVGARVTINTLFPNYALDLICHDQELSRSRDFAERRGTRAMFMAAFDCAIAMNDPRLAHYFAEMAILKRHNAYVYNPLTDVSSERPASHPVETSARLLYLAKKLDQHEGTPVKDWYPRWVEGKIEQLGEAEAVIERAEELGNATKKGE